MLRLWDVDWQAICSYDRRLQIIRLLLIITTFLVCVTCLEGGSPQCVPTKTLHHVTLHGGIAAGDYAKIGKVISPHACANICCKDTRCDVAFMANNMCYNLHCYSAKLCKTRPARESRFIVSVTYVRRGVSEKGRTVLDRGSVKQDQEKSSSNATTLKGHKSGTNLTKQSQDLLHLTNDTRAKAFQNSTFDNERTKKPVISGNSESNYTRIWTNKTNTPINSTNSVKGKLQNVYEKHENRTLLIDANNISSIQGNNFLKHKNQSKVVHHTRKSKVVSNQVVVSWKNDSHILVKELKYGGAARASLNGNGTVIHSLTAEENSTASSKKTPYKQLYFVNDNLTSQNVNSTGGFFQGSKGLATKNLSTNKPIKEKDKLDEKILEKSFYSLNSSVSNRTNYHNNSAVAQLNATRFTTADGALKGKSFKSKEKGMQLDISSPSSSVSKHPSQQRSNDTSIIKTNVSSSETKLSVQSALKKEAGCHSEGVLYNKTLVAGLKSGDFTDYGKVQGIGACVGFCCADKRCDMALMLGSTCYTLHCASPSLCTVRPAHPSSLNPRISFVVRQKLDKSAAKDSQVDAKDNHSESVAPQRTTEAKQVSKRVKGSRCKHGAIQHGVTLQSGQKAGIFKLRLKAKDMDSCLNLCCKDNTCNVAFLIDDSCYSVRCHSHEDCTIAKAKSSSARSSLSVVRSRILPLNDKRQQIPRAEKKYTTVLNITNQLFTKPLADFESLEFLNLAERIQVAVSTVLVNFKEYKESEVISFQPSPLITKLQLTVYDGGPIKQMLVTLVKAVKDGKMVSSIDGSVLTFLLSTSGFKFYTPQGFNLVCDPEFNYDVHWKLTIYKFQTTSPCPRNAQGKTRRSCHGSDNNNATWGFPSFANCVSSEYKTLQSKAKKFAEGAKEKIPFKTLHLQLGVTPSEILIRIQKLTFVDTYRALLDKPHNSTNTTTLHDGNKTTHSHNAQRFNSPNTTHPINTTRLIFANKTFSIPLPDPKKQVNTVPFKLAPHHKLNDSVSNEKDFSSFLPHSSNGSSDKVISNVLPKVTAKTPSNSTLFSDILPQAANTTTFSRMNIPKPLREKISGKQTLVSKQSNSIKPFSLNQVSYGKASSVGSQRTQNSFSTSYNKNLKMLNTKELPFRKSFSYRYQQQQQQQQQRPVPGASNKLEYQQKSLNQFGAFQTASSGQVRSSYPSQLDNSNTQNNQNPESPYAAYRQQLQRLRTSQSSQSTLYDKPRSHGSPGWQDGQFGKAIQLGQGSLSGQSNQFGQNNEAWPNVHSWQRNQGMQGYQGGRARIGQASFPGYGGIPGYNGVAFQRRSDNQNAPEMGTGHRTRRDIQNDLKRTKRQGGNMVWYDNYNLRQPATRSDVYRPSPTDTTDDGEPFLTNVQAGYDDPNPENSLNQEEPLPYNVDYVRRPTPYYNSITYSLRKAPPSPTRATTSESQSEFNFFPTNGVTDQASTRGSFSLPSVPSKDYPTGFTDTMPSAPGGKSQDLVGFGQPQVEHQLTPTTQPLPLPVTTPRNPFFMNQENPKLTSTLSPLTTTQATLKSKQVLKPSSKPSTSVKPSMKPSVKVTQSSAELLKKKLQDMAKDKGVVKSPATTHKHNVTGHLMDDVYQEKNRAPMFGGDIALIVDTLRQLSLYNKYTNPPETIDTLKQFLQVGSHILDKRNKHEWKYLTKESDSSTSALDAAEVIESYSKIVAGKLHPDDMRKPILTTNIMITLRSVDLMAADLSQDIEFPNYSEPSIANWTDATDKIVISPRSMVNALQGTPSKQALQLISCNVRRITDLLPRSMVSKTFGNSSIMGGHVMSVSSSPSLGDNIDPPIKIVLNNNNKDVSSFEEKCVYWKQGSSPNSGRWSSQGCKFIESNLTHTTCECTHMSTFSAVANTAKPKATAPVTVPPTTAPPPEEEGSNILYILLGILALLLIIFVILVIICFLIKRRNRQKESETSKSGGRGRGSGSHSSRSDDSMSTGSGEFDEMLASRRRNVHPERKPSPSDSPRWQRMRKNGENPENLMMKEKSYLMSDYHQPYHFSSAKSPTPTTETSSQRNRSRSS